MGHRRAAPRSTDRPPLRRAVQVAIQALTPVLAVRRSRTISDSRGRTRPTSPRHVPHTMLVPRWGRWRWAPVNAAHSVFCSSRVQTRGRSAAATVGATPIVLDATRDHSVELQGVDARSRNGYPRRPNTPPTQVALLLDDRRGAVFRNERFVPMRRIFPNTLARRVIDIDETEPPRIAVHPFKVIE